ncbi:hypothetical protein B0H14DRAFT_3875267 [Mycena olivaceomarginata]|nr:hypothetical protein B0H14DRAFT_3875267 [Mycena olivaceomarginata]
MATECLRLKFSITPSRFQCELVSRPRRGHRRARPSNDPQVARAVHVAQGEHCWTVLNGASLPSRPHPQDAARTDRSTRAQEPEQVSPAKASALGFCNGRGRLRYGFRLTSSVLQVVQYPSVSVDRLPRRAEYADAADAAHADCGWLQLQQLILRCLPALTVDINAPVSIDSNVFPSNRGPRSSAPKSRPPPRSRASFLAGSVPCTPSHGPFRRRPRPHTLHCFFRPPYRHRISKSATRPSNPLPSTYPLTEAAHSARIKDMRTVLLPVFKNVHAARHGHHAWAQCELQTARPRHAARR